MCIVLYFSPEVNSLLGYHCRLDWGYIHSGRVCSCGICHMQYEVPCAMFHLCLVSFFQFYICISCRIGESTTCLFLSIFYSCLGTRLRVSSSLHRVQKKCPDTRVSRGVLKMSRCCVMAHFRLEPVWSPANTRSLIPASSQEFSWTAFLYPLLCTWAHPNWES